MTNKKGKVLALFPQNRSDGLAEKQYAVGVWADSYFSYLEFDNKQDAEESAEHSWEGFNEVFHAGGTSRVRVTLLEILRISALDRLPLEEREVTGNEDGGNREST